MRHAHNVNWLSPFWLRRRAGTTRNVLAGLAFDAGGMALAVLERSPEGVLSLRHAAVLAAQTADLAKLLPEQAERYGIRHCPVNVVLAPGDYRLLPVPQLEVPEAEMRDALRWRIHEALDFPPEEAEIEYFTMPEPRHAGKERVVMVAAARTAAIRRYEGWLARASLPVSAMDIPELALREVTARLPDSQRGIAVLLLREDDGIVQLQKGDMVYVSRSVDIGLRRIGASAGGERVWNEPQLERLVVEIQRSMDYYENFYGMAPISDLVLTPLASARGLAERLSQSLGMACRILDLGALLPHADGLDDATQQACLLAVGAALRSAAEGP